MRLIVTPGHALRGEVRLPGDKSLSHRALLFAAMAEGESHIQNFLVSGVTRAMLDSLAAMGVGWSLDGTTLIVRGEGLAGWRSPVQPLDCGNSATTLRLLAGAVAAAGIPAKLTGSEGLRRRPMNRIVDPLRRMRVPIRAAEGGLAPLTLEQRLTGQPLTPLDHTIPVASAQVKSCLLLAALAASGETVLREPGPSRDHTERMLSHMGVQVNSLVLPGENGSTAYETRLTPPQDAHLRPITMQLPGDISSAAFLIVAGLIVPGSEICLRGVGLNPTRTGLLDALIDMGADITIENRSDQAGEPMGDLIVRSSKLRATSIGGPLVVRMIDEFSVFGAAAAIAEGCTVVQEAAELRYKESDRIATLCHELSALGIKCEEAPDGFQVWGGQPSGGLVQAHGDHRLAMAMAVAGLAACESVVVDEAEMINETFPSFIDTLRTLGAEVYTEGEAVVRESGGEGDT